jgi:hypothetical protein
MSYEPPFGGNWMTENAWFIQNRKPPPPSIQNAVRFIYAGAAIEALSVIFEIAAVRARIRSVLSTASAPPLTTSQLNTYESVGVGFLIISGVIGASLWLWMARKNRAGRRWARILSTVGFAIYTLATVAAIAQPVPVEDKIIPLAGWLVGFAAIVLLWQTESSDFFAARSRRY